MTGAWLSVTVTIKEQLPVLPDASVAEKVFVVTPTGKVAPLAAPAVCVVEAPGQLSVPVGAEQVTAAPQIPVVLFTEIFAGHVIVGA